MIKIVNDKKNNMITMFNTNSGSYIRKGDSFMASYPHLIDIGIMGNCTHGKTGLCMKAGIRCYQNGLKSSAPNMSLENYKKIIDESEKRTFSVALGGCGDPDMHENFEEILAYSKSKNVIPSFTTSGLGMTPEKAAICKAYCGAVAVSMYSRIIDVPFIAIRERKSDEEKIPYKSLNDIPIVFTMNNMNDICYIDEPYYVINGKNFEWEYLHHIVESDLNGKYELYKVYEEKQEPNYTFKAINMLLKAGVKTNIHFVVSNTTIDEAILRLKYNGFPSGINAVIFLLHKPVGLGEIDDVLNYNDPRVKEFFQLATSFNLPYKVGFDSCSIPGIINYETSVDPISLDTCEGGRFSMYISADMKALPCSFDNQNQKYAVQLSDNVSIEDAWNSNKFDLFRESLKCSCPTCPQRKDCMGGCPLEKDIILCGRKEKDLFVSKE